MKVFEEPLMLLIALLLLLVSPITAKAESFNLSPPETILVRVTGEHICSEYPTYKTQRINFKEYVKGVLPSEWGRKWNEESLKAGAIATKMFAWSMYEARGFVWDCTWSQVYDPRISSEATDKAVDETWDYYLVKDGEPVMTLYNAWINGCHIRGEENCMGQWNSKNDADRGMSWEEIIAKYYDGELICPNCADLAVLENDTTDSIAFRYYLLYQCEFIR